MALAPAQSAVVVTRSSLRDMGVAGDGDVSERHGQDQRGETHVLLM